MQAKWAFLMCDVSLAWGLKRECGARQKTKVSTSSHLGMALSISNIIPRSEIDNGDVVAFKINEKDHPYCKYYGISEIHFIDHVRDTQLDRALKWEKKNL